MEDAVAGHGGNEDHGSAALVLDHVSAAGLGKKKGTGEVDVEEPAEHVGVVGFSFDVGARRQFTRLVKGSIFFDSTRKITRGVARRIIHTRRSRRS